eukprot:12294400-Karenia_brevis.AAC.1
MSNLVAALLESSATSRCSLSQQKCWLVTCRDAVDHECRTRHHHSYPHDDDDDGDDGDDDDD